MYKNAIAKSVMLQLLLQHNIYNILFKIKHKVYMASHSAPNPRSENSSGSK